MHVIICGGRNEHLTSARVRWLETQRVALPITKVYHGAARGIDTEAGTWAEAQGFPVEKMPADWDRYGRAAGRIRNAHLLRKLQRECDGHLLAVLAFRGGTGTADMRTKALAAGITIFDEPEETPTMPTLLTAPVPSDASPAVALYGDRLTALRVVLDQMTCNPYNVPPTKLEKAYVAVVEGRVTARQVISQHDPDVQYIITETTCTCPYGRAHPDEPFACYHATAVRLYQRWQQSLSPMVSTQKDMLMPRASSGPASAPLLTPPSATVVEASPAPQEPSDDIADPRVPPAVVEAATAPLDAAKTLPVAFQAHEALLHGFCQYLQGKMHSWMMDEHIQLTSGMDTMLATMRDWAQKVFQVNEHASYQLADALLTLQTQGLPLRHDPYQVEVTARSSQGFAVTLHIRKQSPDDLMAALPALLDWLTQHQFTPVA